VVGWFGDQLLLWLLALTLEAIKALWGLLAGTALSTPDVTGLPQVQQITSRSLAVVNVGFVLAVITAGVTVMTHETVQVRYGIGEMAPRLVLGWVAANFSMPICASLAELANALTGALTGEGVAAQGAFAQLLRVVADAMNNPASAFLTLVIGLVIAVLTGMLLVAWLVRLGVLVVWVGIAPVALACHATPYTDGAARLWWRTGLACMGTVVLQALALHAALAIFLDPGANVPALGIPHDPTGTFNLFVVACLLWVTVRVPALMRRYVTRGGGHNIAGAFVRLVLVQRLARMIRLPRPRRGGPHRRWPRPVGRDHRHPVLATPAAPADPRRGPSGPHRGGQPVQPHAGGDRPVAGRPSDHRPSRGRVAAEDPGRGHPGHRDAAAAAGLAVLRRHRARDRLVQPAAGPDPTAGRGAARRHPARSPPPATGRTSWTMRPHYTPGSPPMWRRRTGSCGA
jgi:hypothetical protein